MTHVYFVRHAQPDYDVTDNRSRPLTEKGRRDAEAVTAYFADKGVTQVYSSPYRRAVETVSGLARRLGLDIILEEDFIERTISDGWVDDYDTYTQRQWQDFTYKLPHGESLGETQERNLRALHRLLAAHPGGTIVVGSHGAALSTLIHRYDPAFGHEQFLSILPLTPWVAHFVFEGDRLVELTTADPLALPLAT